VADNLHCNDSPICTDHSALDDQVDRRNAVKKNWPANGQFDESTNVQALIGLECDPCATNVQHFAVSYAGDRVSSDYLEANWKVDFKSAS